MGPLVAGAIYIAGWMVKAAVIGAVVGGIGALAYRTVQGRSHIKQTPLQSTVDSKKPPKPPEVPNNVLQQDVRLNPNVAAFKLSKLGSLNSAEDYRKLDEEIRSEIKRNGGAYQNLRNEYLNYLTAKGYFPSTNAIAAMPPDKREPYIKMRDNFKTVFKPGSQDLDASWADQLKTGLDAARDAAKEIPQQQGANTRTPSHLKPTPAA